MKKPGCTHAQVTLYQLYLFRWAASAGLEQHRKFLRHSGWDAELTKRQRYNQMSTDRDFLKVIRLLEKKITEVENG